MSNKPLFLLRNEERRLRAGHLWIYSNEVDNKRSPLKSFEVGELVTVTGQNGKPFGTAYINPHSLICARLLSPLRNFKLTSEFFKAEFAMHWRWDNRYIRNPITVYFLVKAIYCQA